MASYSPEIEFVAQYFYEQGLDVEDIDLLIEELGIMGLSDLICDIAEERTVVQGTLFTKKGELSKKPKITKTSGFEVVQPKKAEKKEPEAQAKRDNSSRQLELDFSARKKPSVRKTKAGGGGFAPTGVKSRERRMPTGKGPSQKPQRPQGTAAERRAARRAGMVPDPWKLETPARTRTGVAPERKKQKPQLLLPPAKEQKPAKPTRAQQLGRTTGEFIRKGLERHQKAVTDPRFQEFVRKGEERQKKAAEFIGKHGTRALRALLPMEEQVELWVEQLIDEGYDLSQYTWDEMYNFYIEESFNGWVNDLIEEGYDLSEYTIDDMIDIYEEELLAERIRTGSGRKALSSRKARSRLAKRARKGEDIGKKGKMFKKVAAKAARRYGSKEAGERVAAAAMYRGMAKRQGMHEAFATLALMKAIKEAQKSGDTKKAKELTSQLHRASEAHAAVRSARQPAPEN